MADISKTRDALKIVNEHSAVARMLEDVGRKKRMIRAALGPVWELQQAGLFTGESAVQRDLAKAQELARNYEAMFSLPERGTVARLVEQAQRGSAIDALTRYGLDQLAFQRTLESMTTPWLHHSESASSIAGLAELQGISKALKDLRPFSDELAVLLRHDLGDWRDQIRLPGEAYTDLQLRGDYYVELGFDPSLTDFPAPAFQEGLAAAHLPGERLPLIALYSPPITPQPDDLADEESLERTSNAHDWLQRLESRLRQFIDARMREVYGPDWPKHQLPADLYEKWHDKKQHRERSGGDAYPLISYIDFTEYERVICKKDNWRQVFKPYFERPENVRESFHRMRPIRTDTMHARPITQEDELLLYVEVQRLDKAIK